jgi:type I restriction enzyme S subunit
VLGLVQRAIEQQERLIALTTELKKSLLHKLFTEGLRGEPQKQTEIGPVPESWEVIPLGKHCSLQGGFAFKSGDFVSAESGIPIIKIGDLQDGEVRLSERSSFAPTRFWDREALKNFRLTRGNLLIALTGATTGKTADFQLDRRAFLNQRVGRFLHDETRLRPTFLKQLVVQPYFQQEIQRNILAAAQGNISPKRMEQFAIGLPSLDEQDEIGTTLGTLDVKVSVARRKLDSLTDLFRTLLHQLMTAQIRVGNLDLPVLEADELIEGSSNAAQQDRH